MRVERSTGKFGGRGLKIMPDWQISRRGRKVAKSDRRKY
jgi:hypothetical protein